MNRRALSPFVGALVLVVAAAPVAGEWIEGGVPLCLAPGTQGPGDIVRLEMGTFVTVWQDYRDGSADIYAQMIDSYGNIMWTDGGAAVYAGAGDQASPRVISDGVGGSIVVWADARSGASDIYAQRLDPSGNALWDPNGVPICAATGEQFQVELVPDGYGGAIMTWRDSRSGDADIYAQRINGGGTAQWYSGGVAVCYAASSQFEPQIAADGSGGAVIAWTDLRYGTYDIFAQRVSGEGFMLWTANGVAVSTAADYQGRSRVAWGEGGRTLIAWEDSRLAAGRDIYAQALSSGGEPLWTADGVAVCNAVFDQYIVGVVSDGNAGLIVAWNDWRGPSWDIYAQRVANSGSVRWTADGAIICGETGDQYGTSMVSDGAGGAIIAWRDLRDDTGDIYVQRFGGTYGSIYWGYAGVALCLASGYQGYPLLDSDGEGGAVVFWEDERSGEYNLFVNRVDHYGYWGYACPWLTALDDVPHDQGGRLMLTWNASRLDRWYDTGVEYYSIWRMLPLAETQALLAKGIKDTGPEKIGRGFRGNAYRFKSAAGVTTGWEWIANTEGHNLPEYSYTASTLYDSTGASYGWHYFFVSAHGYNGGYWDSPAGIGYSVDNLAPCTPLGLAGEPSYDPAGLQLSWASNHEVDLGEYRIYRGTDPDFVPGAGNLIGSTCDTLLLDGGWTSSGGYYYKLAAVDIHGNESGYALLTPEDVTGGETPEAPEASYLAQNFPNPFNPVTRIAFGLSSPGRVSLRIYDASGRVVRPLLEGSRPAGHYSETWDGLNARGEEMASGVYFYRLEAGSFTQTKKMVLLR